ncbi:MAG TPA: serine/threonine protein kinase [Pyrinomonadaceae bacterium]|nr:serine/threonine protein kinase [Pyrinomonadaceae bacterium]
MSELKLQQCRLDGRYDIRDCLGRGAYSEVYVADDLAASDGQPRTVVIKALNPYLQGVPDPELERTLVENFRNEAVALDRVRHPNIISRLGHGTAIDLQDRTFHYLVLEYMPGGDLQALVRRRPLPLEGALFYLEQVAAGLAHAHRHGVIHRDVKPQNLLLTADQHTVKIADFGVAKIEAAEGAITRVGTDVYAAPEHHPLATTGPLDTASLSRRVVQLTPAADVYSLAKTTYMLLTGEAPRRFSQKPITALPVGFASQPWAAYVLRVLERATRTNPEKRTQTVEEFWREMKDAAMPRTQRLDSNAPNGGRARREEVATPPPPAPTFDRQARASGGEARHRIVVPIARGAQPEVREAAPVARRQEAREPSAADPYASAEQFIASREPSLSSRARSLLVALLLLLAFAGMLYATYTYVQQQRGANRAGGAAQAGAGQAGAPAPVGREFFTTTDVYLRGGPSQNYPDIGLAERGSRVVVLEANGRWRRVRVVEHSRVKKEPESSDEGWLNSTYLRER